MRGALDPFIKPFEFRADLRDGLSSPVVNPDPVGIKFLGRAIDSFPVVSGKHPAVDAVAVDIGAGADASHIKLDPAHPHRDDGDILAEVYRDMIGDVEAEAGLSHARPGADEYQVGFLES